MGVINNLANYGIPHCGNPDRSAWSRVGSEKHVHLFYHDFTWWCNSTSFTSQRHSWKDLTYHIQKKNCQLNWRQGPHEGIVHRLNIWCRKKEQVALCKSNGPINTLSCVNQLPISRPQFFVGSPSQSTKKTLRLTNAAMDKFIIYGCLFHEKNPPLWTRFEAIATFHAVMIAR